MHSLLKYLAAGLAVVSQVANALPQPANDATSVHGIEKRAAAPIIKVVSGHSGLYVPMMYAGYVDAASGNYERYQCDLNSGDAVFASGVLASTDKAAVTDGLASCVSVSVITIKGTLKTHVPPYLCPVIQGQSTDAGLKNQLKILQQSLKKLIRAHSADLDRATMVTVSGAYSTESDVKQLLERLFGNDLSRVGYKLEIPLEPTNDHRSTVVDLTVTPPRLFIEGQQATY